MYHQEEIAPAIIQISPIHSDQYRRDVIAEILHYGRAAAKNDSCFRHQVEAWSAALEKISSDELMKCYALASRWREKRFDDEPLAAYELLAAWQNLKTNNQESSHEIEK